MATACILINGVTLPYAVIDAAIGWARANGRHLRGVILYADERKSESYPFPSDIEMAEVEVTDNEGEQDLGQLIRDNALYIQKQCRREQVELEGLIFQDPDRATVAHALQDVAIIFTDASLFDGQSLYARLPYSSTDLRQLFSGEIREIPG